MFYIKQKNKGFSLIELMVVLGIMGIIAALAIPSYNAYVIKSKISTVIPLLKSYQQTVISRYEVDAKFPDPVKSEIGDIVKAGNVAITTTPPAKFVYYNTTSDGNGFYFCASMDDLNIDSLTPPSAGNDGTSNRICMLSTYTNGVWETRCGNLNATDAQNLPLTYLPSGCSCADVTTPAC